MFLDILNNQLKYNRDVSSLQTGIIAGAICPMVLMHRLIDELGLNDLTICYGMTELSPVSTGEPVYSINVQYILVTIG